MLLIPLSNLLSPLVLAKSWEEFKGKSECVLFTFFLQCRPEIGGLISEECASALADVAIQNLKELQKSLPARLIEEDDAVPKKLNQTFRPADIGLEINFLAICADWLLSE